MILTLQETYGQTQNLAPNKIFEPAPERPRGLCLGPWAGTRLLFGALGPVPRPRPRPWLHDSKPCLYWSSTASSMTCKCKHGLESCSHDLGRGRGTGPKAPKSSLVPAHGPRQSPRGRSGAGSKILFGARFWVWPYVSCKAARGSYDPLNPDIGA